MELLALLLHLIDFDLPVAFAVAEPAVVTIVSVFVPPAPIVSSVGPGGLRAPCVACALLLPSFSLSFFLLFLSVFCF